MILVAVPLCDPKAYAQTIALDAIAAQDFNLKEIVLFIDVQTKDVPGDERTPWNELLAWTLRAEELFAGVVIDWWWDTRDQGYGDNDMGKRIRPIALAREKARIYAMNRVMWKGYIEAAAPKPGVDGAAWYSPVSETDGREITHIWYVDADVAPPPHALGRLLALNVPLASGVFWGRLGNGGRGVPYVFQKYLEGHGYGVHFLRRTFSGVIEADFVGAGCLLVREDLFQRVSWRHWKVDADETFWSEDAYYCFDAERAGFGKVKVDSGITCKHHDPSGAVT